MVNNIAEYAASQQMAIAANQGLSQELSQIDQSLKQEKAKDAERSYVSRLLESKPSDSGMDILSGLAAKLSAAVGLKSQALIKKLGRQFKNEAEQLMEQPENFIDSVNIREAVRRARQRQGRGAKKGSQGKALPTDAETVNDAKEYATMSMQYSMNGGQELKKQLERLEAKLREKGFTLKDLLSLRTSARNSIRNEIAQQIRKHLMRVLTSPQKSVELTLNNKSLHNVLDFAFLNHRLGGKDFGGHMGGLQATTDAMLEEARDELQGYLSEKIQEKMVARNLANDRTSESAHRNELEQLLKMSGKVGLDLDEFVKNWQIKKLHLGLLALSPDFLARAQSGGAGAGSQNQSQEKSPYEMTREDEKELLLSRMRALYMKRALLGDMRTFLETTFKMKRLKNGLLRLGIQSDGFKQLEKEGNLLARTRLLSSLKKALEERATLYELKGPAFRLIERKLKGIMKNLERLGLKLNKLEFNSMRDAVNLRVYEAAKEELNSLDYIMEASKNPMVEKKRALVIKLIQRLREESGFNEDFDVKDIYVVKEMT